MPTAQPNPAPRETGVPSREVVEDARKLFKSIDWPAYWSRVDEQVAREVDAYAEARVKSQREFNNCVLR
ncbi:MAG: hypothetical protein NTV46_02910 [Verrucomicrobia bacterium]|nr:hypothetical protein [Verrucomicrobiota bacterium]